MAPRLMRLAETPNQRMPTAPNNIEIGMARETNNAPRRLPRTARSTTTTSTAPSAMLLTTVLSVASTRKLRV